MQRNSGHDGTLATNIAIISELEVNNFKRKLQRHDSTFGACVEQYVCQARLRQWTMYHFAPRVEGKFKVDRIQIIMHGKVDV